jgi:hypothetical protein
MHHGRFVSRDPRKGHEAGFAEAVFSSGRASASPGVSRRARRR